jgi:DNA-binding transcriptional regulator LsrR (DeoR family)
MSHDVSASDLRLTDLIRIAAIARRHYLDGASKVEIAQEFGLSRFQVARLLRHARDTGLVRIDITVPAGIDAELSDGLRAAYGLHHAIVVSADGHDSVAVRPHLAQAAAAFLTDIVVEGDVLGLACSRTLNDLTHRLDALARCTVIQLTGALSNMDVEENSVELVRRVASLAGGPAYPIYAPLVVSDSTTAELLRHQPQVAQVMSRYRDITKAVVAVGSWDPPDSQVRAAMTESEAPVFDRLGVCAEVCAQLLDAEGRPIDNDLSQRVIAITVEGLRNIPEVIAVAGGSTKVAAIRAVLVGGLATSLVTDAGVARELLRRRADVVSGGAVARDRG